MPDKTLRVVTYAAGASLAAITLIYVFGPTYFLDSEPSTAPSGAFSTRKRGVVGLANPANDCFINSVLQALAGLGDLRLYLIREIHRRSLDDESVYSQLVPPGVLAEDGTKVAVPRFAKDVPEWKLEGLQRGSVTKSLKDTLDALNERPIYKKTISAAPFVRALEEAFRQRISRQQQDAQEFLQVVAERLCDEYHAGRRARYFASHRAAVINGPANAEGVGAANGDAPNPPGAASQKAFSGSHQAHETARVGIENSNGAEEDESPEEEEGFPMEGRFESQIECLTCGFKPRPTTSTFCTLTLNVPQLPATTLAACFDGMFKTEYIDDFKCEKCRLLHSLALFESERQRYASEAARARAQADAERLRLAIDTDPEAPPEDVVLPDLRHAPKRRIARHIRMTQFPKILSIHLSRSIFDASRSSQKNLAKVVFPEELPLGGLLQQRKYRLLGVVTHKGSHHSGHYESFRRQSIHPPFSNPSTFQASEVYSRTASPAPTPRTKARGQPLEEAAAASLTQNSPVREADGSVSPPSPCPGPTPAGSLRNSPCVGMDAEGSLAGLDPPAPALGSWTQDTNTASRESIGASLVSGSPKAASSPSLIGTLKSGSASDRPSPSKPSPSAATKSKQRKQQSRWWRISDDKVKEASTRDVLGMQREVYLLFYELERPPS
ncbi:hypothetical protein C8A03DRAFT_42909 [Achaetomium macrosporum]|uniref:Ubiquitin carboxyl-terminal hydrolase n=1 Tax=Achaetomium macrosporum TaxID=79813 RepID=A0AAN7CCG9_9PEZI|nr:hypothetical protein C8A03DRAFT_42909 [Achaetomium macrosporum]